MKRVTLTFLISVLNYVAVFASADTITSKQPYIKWQQFISSSPLALKLSFPIDHTSFLEQFELTPHLSIGYLNYVEKGTNGLFKYNIGVRYGMVELHRHLGDLGKTRIELLAGGGFGHYDRMASEKPVEDRFGHIVSGGIQASRGSFVFDVRLNNGGTIPGVYPSYNIGVQGVRGRSFFYSPGIIVAAGCFWLLMFSLFGFG